jgi:Cytochrome c7 and related cytochrome c/Class III cytochrome C family
MKPGITSFALLFCLFGAIGSRSSSAHRSALSPTNAQGKDAAATKPEPPVQPIPYSHKKHLAIGLRCQQCHPNPEPGDRMTFPAVSRCMGCHANISKDKAPIQKLADYAKSGTAIPWARVYVLPGWVYWNHRSHLEAQMTCEMCHGQVADMDVMRKATNVTTMAGCIECHRENDASTGCKYCHADK